MNTVTQTAPIETGEATAAPARNAVRRSVQVRLFLTCWLIYLIHFSPFVVRELYLAISLAERHTVRVDPYVDLHPDLFTLEGRGSYLGNNPGAAFLAAVPYWLALPVVNKVAPVRPAPLEHGVSVDYKEERINKLQWYKKVRERGLDVRLGLGALITSGFFMAPLAALSAVVMLRLLAGIGFSERVALWMAFLYALGTPIFFRAGTLSLNLLVTLFGFFALVLLWWPSGARPERHNLRWFAAGLLAGWCVLSDYTGAISAAVLGLFAIALQWKRPMREVLPAVLWFSAGAAIPVALLLVYQWYCFGNPWLPAQFYLPKKVFLGYPSERGFGWPLPAALWGLLFDPQYGLLVFAPLFALALYHPVLVARGQNRVPKNIAVFSWLFFAALYIFCSCIHYTVRHQWQDGVRYIVPALPFLFLLVADVVARMPRGLAWLVAVLAIFETWALSMVRESPLDSIARVLAHGPQFPWFTTLTKTAAQYWPALGDESSLLVTLLPSAIVVWMLAAIWLIWSWRRSDTMPQAAETDFAQ